MKATQSEVNKQALAKYRDALTRLIRVEMTVQKITYVQLSERLEHIGVTLSEANVRNKVGRGQISGDLLMAIYTILNISSPASYQEILEQIERENQ